MSTVGTIIVLVNAIIVVAQAWACWGNILVARGSDKVLSVAFVALGIASFASGATLVSMLWFLVASYSISEMNLKARVRALGGAA